MVNLDGLVVLITGGTGSFGQKFTQRVLACFKPKKLIIFSRDELKQFEMRQRFGEEHYPCLRYFIGDVRDQERLYRAFDGVDIVVHAAALKQVPAAEYNPSEAVKTNVLGAMNVVNAAIDRGVKRVIALSSDKAANPINLYGATKLCSDKLFVAANSYSGARATRFSIVRYGNVVGSRGSVLPYFLSLRATGTLPITDTRMTRFWITLEQGVDFVLKSLARMRGGEIFVPKIPSMRITDLARAVAPECTLKIVGIRPGEKLHETLVSEDDARHAVEYDDYYAILPVVHSWDAGDRVLHGGRPCPDGFCYRSDRNTHWLTIEELRKIAGLEDVRENVTTGN
ncbi:MAG: UDP-N-acetylglucosamine 4,6-dehydratase (inverting) [candidate division WOR-3 bacterium]